METHRDQPAAANRALQTRRQLVVGYRNPVMARGSPAAATFLRRSRRTQESWLGGLPHPLLRLDAAGTIDALVAGTLAWLDRERSRA